MDKRDFCYKCNYKFKDGDDVKVVQVEVNENNGYTGKYYVENRLFCKKCF